MSAGLGFWHRQREGTVGLIDRFVKLLDRGTPPVRDPTEMVDVITASLFDATLIVERLRSHGIEAQSIEAINLVTRMVTDARVQVPRSQFDEAHRLLS